MYLDPFHGADGVPVSHPGSGGISSVGQIYGSKLSTVAEK